MANVAGIAAKARPLLRGRDASASATLSESVAFDLLYESTFETVYRYAWTITRDDTCAEDVTAEVYLRAWRNRASFRGEGSQLSWLLSIAHNTALSARRSARATADLEAIAEVRDDAAAPIDTVIAAADAETVHRAMLALTEEQRQVIFLRFFEGLRHDAVASRLGRNPNAVRAIQFRAISRLRKLLEDSVVVQV